VIPSDEPLRLPAELAQQEVYKKEVRLEAQDIRYLHEEIPSGRLQRVQSFAFWGLAGLNLLGLLVVANGLLRNRRESLFSRDLGLKRRTLARALASRRLKRLKRFAESRKETERERFIEEAEKVLSEYFSNKFNVSSYSFTRQWLEAKLTEIWPPEDPLLREIREFYDLAQETRFGKGALPARERRQFLDLIEKVIRQVERLR
jgi:hypothetical protein